MTKLYSFEDFPEHKQHLPRYAETWIKHALRTDPLTEEDKAISTKAVLDMYALAKLPAPKVVFCKGPVTGAVAAAFLSAFIEHKTKPTALELTGNKSTDAVVEVLADFFDIVPTKVSGKKTAPELDRWAVQDGSFVELAKQFGDVGKLALTYASQTRDAYFQSGQQSSDYCSFYSFMRDIAKLPIDWFPFSIYEALALHSGERYVAAEFCLLTERPLVLKMDEQRRPHAENGPFQAWADGIKLYSWHGTNVPAEFIERKESIDPSRALTEPNGELRRALCEILGWKQVLESVKQTIIDTDPDPQIGQLIEVSLPSLGRQRFIRVQCGTGREFVIPVPPDSKTALEANAWTYRISGDFLREKENRT